MKEFNRLAVKSSWLSPDTRKKVNKFRLYTDILGLLLVYTFGGLFPPSIQWILSVYTILAWITILTIDPSRLPDVATTSLKQKIAWKKFLKYQAPIFLIILGFMIFLKAPILIKSFSMGNVISSFIQSCLLEMLYRNILQPKIRQLGVNSFASILLQSVLFAILFYMNTKSLLVFSGSLALGAVTGLAAYTTRSIQPNILLLFLWMCLF